MQQQRDTKKTNFLFTCRGGDVKPNVFDPIGLRSLEMCEDSHQEKYVMITLLQPKRVNQVKACLDDYNMYQRSDKQKIVLSGLDEEIVTFGKGVDTVKNNHIYKRIMAERVKAQGDGPHTWSIWTVDGESPGQQRTLKMLRSELTGKVVLTSNPKRESRKPLPLYPAEDATGKRKAAKSDTESEEGEGGAAPGLVHIRRFWSQEEENESPEPAAESGPPKPAAESGPPKPVESELPKPMRFVEATFKMHERIIGGKDEVIQTKDEVITTERKSFERERAAFERERVMLKEMLEQALRREREKSDALTPAPKRGGKRY